jgi:hypothetical protein
MPASAIAARDVPARSANSSAGLQKAEYMEKVFMGAGLW